MILTKARRQAQGSRSAIALVSACAIFAHAVACELPVEEEASGGGGGSSGEEEVAASTSGGIDPDCADGDLGCVVGTPLDDVDRCPDGFPRGTPSDLRLVEEFSPALEGVAVCPNGDVFVSQPETAKIYRVPLDGAPAELWTTLAGHQPLGMDCASDNVLYVADFGSNDATVFRVAAKDDPATPLPTIVGDGGYKAMNGVAVVDGVGIYATDRTNTIDGRIILFAETSPNVFEASVARGGLPFPNDVAFNPKTGMLDVTLTINSQVLSYSVADDGAFGSQSVSFSGTWVLDALDGLAVAEDGDRYLAQYLQGKVRRASDWQMVAGMTEPKSLAFRGGTLFVTAKKGLYAVDLAVCGAER
ncbi:MAG: hypothetical protein HOV80_27360 [Polyangiaceae bacterium]|nr:hypothetical protein [Polyangiaceae bacterium]